MTARQAALELYDELAAENASYRKIYEAWKQFQTDSNQWFSASEQVLFHSQLQRNRNLLFHIKKADCAVAMRRHNQPLLF